MLPTSKSKKGRITGYAIIRLSRWDFPHCAALVASGRATDSSDGIRIHWRSPTFTAYWFVGSPGKRLRFRDDPASNDPAQLPGLLGGLDVSESEHAVRVSCSGWLGKAPYRSYHDCDRDKSEKETDQTKKLLLSPVHLKPPCDVCPS